MLQSKHPIKELTSLDLLHVWQNDGFLSEAACRSKPDQNLSIDRVLESGASRSGAQPDSRHFVRRLAGTGEQSPLQCAMRVPG